MFMLLAFRSVLVLEEPFVLSWGEKAQIWVHPRAESELLRAAIVECPRYRSSVMVITS